MSKESLTPSSAPAAASTGPKVHWDDTQLKSSYANVCNVSSTREEVVLVFGMNDAWQQGQKQVSVRLTDRVILSPFAAKRMVGLLASVVREYEARFGVLNVGEPAKTSEQP